MGLPPIGPPAGNAGNSADPLTNAVDRGAGALGGAGQAALKGDIPGVVNALTDLAARDPAAAATVRTQVESNLTPVQRGDLARSLPADPSGSNPPGPAGNGPNGSGPPGLNGNPPPGQAQGPGSTPTPGGITGSAPTTPSLTTTVSTTVGGLGAAIVDTVATGVGRGARGLPGVVGQVMDLAGSAATRTATTVGALAGGAATGATAAATAIVQRITTATGALDGIARSPASAAPLATPGAAATPAAPGTPTAAAPGAPAAGIAREVAAAAPGLAARGELAAQLPPSATTARAVDTGGRVLSAADRALLGLAADRSGTPQRTPTGTLGAAELAALLAAGTGRAGGPMQAIDAIGENMRAPGQLSATDAQRLADGSIGGAQAEARTTLTERLAIELAQGDQQGYGHAPDDFELVALSRGDRIYGALPGQSAYYTDAATLDAAGDSRALLFGSLQQPPHPEFGLPPGIGEFEVLADMTVPFGHARANPDHGPGEGAQYFIADHQEALALVRAIPLRA